MGQSTYKWSIWANGDHGGCGLSLGSAALTCDCPRAGIDVRAAVEIKPAPPGRVATADSSPHPSEAPTRQSTRAALLAMDSKGVLAPRWRIGPAPG